MLNFDLFDIPWFNVRMFKLCAGYAFKVENICKVNFKHTNLCMELGAATQAPKMIKPLSKFLGICQQHLCALDKAPVLHGWQLPMLS